MSVPNWDIYAAGALAEARIKLEAADNEREAGRWIAMRMIVWEVEQILRLLRGDLPDWRPESAVLIAESRSMRLYARAARGGR